VNIDYQYKPYTARRIKRGVFTDTYAVFYEETKIRVLNGMPDDVVDEIVGLLNSAFLCGQCHMAARVPQSFD